MTTHERQFLRKTLALRDRELLSSKWSYMYQNQVQALLPDWQNSNFCWPMKQVKLLCMSLLNLVKLKTQTINVWIEYKPPKHTTLEGMFFPLICILHMGGRDGLQWEDRVNQMSHMEIARKMRKRELTRVVKEEHRTRGLWPWAGNKTCYYLLLTSWRVPLCSVPRRHRPGNNDSTETHNAAV